MLTKDEILSITDKAIKEVEVPEWGGSVYVRGVTLEDVDFFATLAEDSGSLENLIIRFVSDEQGTPLFSEEDTPALKKKSLQALKRIAEEIKAFNSLEGAEKNS